jgi:hypothetical protein
MKNDATKGSVSSEEDILVSNQAETELVHAEFIRDRMVNLDTDSEAELNITGSDQYSNSYSLSIGYIRRKMVTG